MTSKSFKQKISAALATLTAAALLGCQASKVPPKYVPPGVQPVNITVTWDATAKTITVAPDPAGLWVGKQYGVWILLNAPAGSKLGVKFQGEDPLEPNPPAAAGRTAEAAAKAQDDVVKRGVPKPGTEGKRYKYNVEIRFPDGTNAHLDPDIDIWP